MRKALLIALVVLLVVTGLPFLMPGCASCPPAHACLTNCSTMPAGTVLFLTFTALAIVVVLRQRRSSAFAWSVDPPPRRTS